jgi:DNA-directed RNA polymerase specialized sigma24 family protein
MHKNFKPLEKAKLGEAETDYRLLKDLAHFREQGKDEEARAVYGVFHSRHREILMHICKRACRHSLYTQQEELAQDVFSNTVKRIYQYASSIFKKLKKHRRLQPKEFSIRLKTYISLMAKNEYNRYIKEVVTHAVWDKIELRDEEGLRIGEEEIIKNRLMLDGYTEQLEESFIAADEAVDYGSDVDGYTQEQVDVVLESLACLSDKQQDVLITYLRFQPEGGHLPDEHIAVLCKKWDLLPGSLRGIKRRALKRFYEKVFELTGLRIEI